MEEENKNVEEQVTETPVVEQTPAVEPTPEVAQAEEMPTPIEPAADPAPVVQEQPQIMESAVVPEKKKGKGGLIFLLLLLLVGGGFAAWYFAFGGKDVISGKKEEPKQEEKKEEEKKEEEKKEEEPKLTKVDVESDEVTKAIEVFGYYRLTDEELTNKGTNSLTEITLPQTITALGNYLESKNRSIIAYCGSELKQALTYDELNKYLKDFTDVEIHEDTFVSSGKKGNHNVTYNNTVEAYQLQGKAEYNLYLYNGGIYITSNNCDSLKTKYIVNNKLLNAEKDDNYLYVYEKRGFYDSQLSNVETESGHVVTFTYYKDYEKKELVEQIDGYSTPFVSGSIYHQPKDLDWDKYETFKYTFKIKDGNYYFQKYEIVK